MGRLLGVEQLVVGSVQRVGEVVSLNLRLVDVGSGEILQSHASDSPGMEKVLTVGCTQTARKFAGLPMLPEPGSQGLSGLAWAGIGAAVLTVAGVAVVLVGSDEGTPAPEITNETIELK